MEGVITNYILVKTKILFGFIFEKMNLETWIKLELEYELKFKGLIFKN